MCSPSANGCVTSFSNRYLFKFGGILSKTASSQHIEMYSVVDNAWVNIDPSLERQSTTFWLMSFCAGVQINEREIFVFGGYNDAQNEASSNLSYTLNGNRWLMQSTKHLKTSNSSWATSMPSHWQWPKASGRAILWCTTDACMLSRTLAIPKPTKALLRNDGS